MPYEILDDIEETKPSSSSSPARLPIQLGSRFVAGAVGLPGDILSGVSGLVNLAGTGIARGAGALTGKDVRFDPIDLTGGIIPTSGRTMEAIREHPLIGEFQKPQSDTEEFIGDILEAVPALFNPADVASKGRFALGIGKSLLKGAAGKGVRGVIKKLGGSNFAQGMGELGTYLLMSFAPGMLKEAINQRYDSFETALKSSPQAVKEITPKIDQAMGNFEKLARSGKAGSPHKAWMQETINEFKQQPSNIENVYEFYKDLNKEWGAGKVPQGAGSFFHDFKKDILVPIIEEWGKTNKVGAVNDFITANDMFAAQAKSSPFRDMINKLASNSNISKATAGILLGAPFFKPIAPIGGLGIGAALSARGLTNVIEPIMRNPKILNVYASALKDGLAGKLAEANKKVIQLDSLVKKELGAQAEGRYEIID